MRFQTIAYARWKEFRQELARIQWYQFYFAERKHFEFINYCCLLFKQQVRERMSNR